MNLETIIRSEQFKQWPDYARDAFNERIAIMREANKISDDQETPDQITTVALLQAEAEMELATV